MKTIKLIDLLVKMANKKQMPKKIEYLGCEWEYSELLNDYYCEETDSFLVSGRFDLNKKIEILEDILDKKEKEYLKAFIKPFRKRIKSIVKTRCLHSKDQYLIISFDNEIDNIELPLFEQNSMYKGMEIDKEYTIEELGL